MAGILLNFLILFLAGAGFGYMWNRITRNRVTDRVLLIGGVGVLVCVVLVGIDFYYF